LGLLSEKIDYTIILMMKILLINVWLFKAIILEKEHNNPFRYEFLKYTHLVKLLSKLYIRLCISESSKE